MKKTAMISLALAGLAQLLLPQRSGAQQMSTHSMDYYITHAPFKMPALTEPTFAAKTFNITDYGAISDGQTLNTAAFEKAITACNAAGGGTVLIPPGLWLTGPIELKSNVNLHADRGALILFSTDHTLFPIVDGRVKSPLSGYKLENVGITGEGVYDGGGDSWRPLKKTKAAPSLWSDLTKSGGAVSADGSMYWPTKAGMDGEAYLKKLKGKANLTADDYLPARDFLRPTMVSLQGIKNLLLDGPTFKNSPQFALNPKNCTNMIIRNVTINNEYYAQNGDAMDLSACKNAIVYRCTINAGDDGICMKSSGKSEDNSAALKNIIIADCIVNHAHGGFVIGSNTDAGMQNIYVTNCDFINTDVGIRVKSSRGRGGLVHDIFIDHIFMHDILNEAILFSTYYEDGGKDGDAGKTFEVNDKTPRFQDFNISNVYCNNAKIGISITGLPEMPVSKITMTDLVISAEKGMSAIEASDISLKNVKLLSPQKTLITLENAWGISLNNIGFDKATTTFISATGAKTKDVKISGTALKLLPDAVKVSGIDKSSIILQ